mmetsp:Transcript_29873/g.101534  ORF Transcript_29873/g.101534 Transcript_29873/m.101534 type:complete len:383 (+) Transcript_29873:64-1212(+)
MRNGQRGREDAEDEERLGRALVLDVVLDGVLEEVLGLGPDLGRDEPAEDQGVGRLADVREVRRHRDLRDVDHARADVLGAVDAEGHGQGLEAELAVALDGLEVVDDGDAQPREGVEHRQHDDVGRQLAARGARADLAEHGLAAPPGQRDVGRAQREGPAPALGLELEGRRRVEVGHDGAEARDEADGVERVAQDVVARPGVAAKGEGQAAKQEGVDLLEDLLLGNAARRDRPVGLVDRVEVAVVPVVDGLAEAREAGSAEDHARQGLGQVLAALREARAAEQRPPVVARRRRAAGDAPDEGHPGPGLRELDPDLPERLVLRVRGAAEAHELAEAARADLGVALEVALGAHDRRRRVDAARLQGCTSGAARLHERRRDREAEG